MNTSFLRRSALFGGVALVALFSVAGRAEIIEQVLVKVNGEIFTKTDLELRQAAALRQSGQDLDPANDPTGEKFRQLLSEVTPQLIVSVVDEMLIVQHGTELGYRMGDEQFESVLTNIKQDNKIETDEALKEALKQEGMTLADLRQNVERQMIFSRVRQNEVTGVAVSDEEAERYYKAHLDDFTTKPSVTLREILVATSDNAAPATEQARTKADGIRERALAGESFEELASTLSDSPSRTNAGLIGPLNLVDLNADFQKLLEGMDVGDITPVVSTPRGFQLLKLESKTETVVTPFGEAREKILDLVYQQKAQRQFQTFIEGLRAQAIIDWKAPEIQKAYEQGLAQLKAQLASAL